MKNNYIFKNFINNKEYKKKLTELVRRMSNLEIGGYRMYDGTGTHYMQNPKEIVDLIFFLKKHEKQYSFKLKNFLEIGFAAGVNNTFLNKLFNFKKIVAVDYVQPAGINTNTFFANLRFKNLIFICGDSTSKETINNVKVNGKFDLIFIDGGHDYKTIKQDFENYSNLTTSKGVIAIHDIFSDTCPGVPKYWGELKKNYKSKYSFIELYDSNQEFNYGIGIVKPKKINNNFSIIKI